MCEAILQIEQRKVGTLGSAGLPQCLDLHYEEDFLKKQSHQVPAVFSDPLFVPSMANVVYKAFKPPVVLKASLSASSRKVPSVSSQPEDGGPIPEMSEPKESARGSSKTSQRVQERVTEASNTDSDKTDEPTPEKEQPPRGLKVKISCRLRKCGNKAMTSSSKDGATPSKVRKEDFLEKRSHQVPAVFSDLFFVPSMANAVYKAFKPPVVPKASPSASSRKVPSISSQPEDGGPIPEMSELKESTPSTSKTSQQVQE